VKLGSILISLLMIYRALAYLVSMQNAWNGFLSSSGAIVSINELYKDFQENKERTEGAFLDKIEKISLKNVGLTIGKTVILDNVSIDIEKNQTIGFVGESGSGKTSLINIISSLIKPTSGLLLYNSRDVNETDLQLLRNRVGYITQEPVIFDDNIFNNVTFWDTKNEASIEKFWQVIEMVNLKEFVESIPNKEETRVGNNGIMISGGQKQRISIARELYKGIDLLIMDEATSALDTETEKIIKDNIDALSGRLTILIIAHRLSSIKNADLIYLMNKGKIISSGTFDELYKNSSYFKNIVDLQAV
jgi:subfamily B ATP-binding cassette protein MsbA